MSLWNTKKNNPVDKVNISSASLVIEPAAVALNKDENEEEIVGAEFMLLKEDESSAIKELAIMLLKGTHEEFNLTKGLVEDFNLTESEVDIEDVRNREEWEIKAKKFHEKYNEGVFTKSFDNRDYGIIYYNSPYTRGGRGFSVVSKSTEGDKLGIDFLCEITPKNDVRVNEIYFDKSKFTMEKAKDWVQNHSNNLSKGVEVDMKVEDIQKLVKEGISAELTPLIKEIQSLKPQKQELEENTIETPKTEEKTTEIELTKENIAEIVKNSFKEVKEEFTKEVSALKNEFTMLKETKIPPKTTSQIKEQERQEFTKDATSIDLGDGTEFVKGVNSIHTGSPLEGLDYAWKKRLNDPKFPGNNVNPQRIQEAMKYITDLATSRA